MPFAKSAASPGGDLVASHPATKLTTRHRVRASVSDPINFKISHSINVKVSLLVEYLATPYPQIEIQCHPQLLPFMPTAAA